MGYKEACVGINKKNKCKVSSLFESIFGFKIFNKWVLFIDSGVLGFMFKWGNDEITR